MLIRNAVQVNPIAIRIIRPQNAISTTVVLIRETSLQLDNGLFPLYNRKYLFVNFIFVFI
jgi:hypothetical protein